MVGPTAGRQPALAGPAASGETGGPGDGPELAARRPGRSPPRDHPMTRPAFRPRLAALEDRLNPATPPVVVWNALLQVKADTTAMHYAADHVTLALSPNHQADTRTLMTAVEGHFDMVVPIL